MALITGNANNNSLPGTARRATAFAVSPATTGSKVVAATTSSKAVTAGTRSMAALAAIFSSAASARHYVWWRGSDTFRFDDRDAGDATAGPFSNVIRDFSAGDVLHLISVDVLDFYGLGSQPSRGTFSVWQSANIYVTWKNTFGGYHDIQLTGFTGDLFSHIRWYEDDYAANVNTTGRSPLVKPAPVRSRCRAAITRTGFCDPAQLTTGFYSLI